MNLLYPDPCYKEDSVIKRLHYISTVNVIYFIFLRPGERRKKCSPLFKLKSA